MKVYLIAPHEQQPHALAQLEAAFDLDRGTIREERSSATDVRTAVDVELRTPEISRKVASHVLAHFGAGGYMPGSFYQDFIMLVARADPTRRRRLALAEPAYVLAVSIAQDSEHGVAMLQAIAAGEPVVAP